MQPGIRWGPFTLRIPFYHFRFEWPETIQGLVVAGATGLALIPILVDYFGVDYQVALAIVIVQAALIASAPIVFGDPYCHGWITPAIPLVLAEILAIRARAAPDAADSVVRLEVIQTITALTLLVAAIFFVGGITGLGRWFVERIPVPLKAGIILGAAISAFNHELAGSRSYLYVAPYACLTAVAICLVLMFSIPLAQVKVRARWLAVLSGLGLAPGFIAAALVGHFISGEFTLSAEGGLERPPFATMWRELSPLSIGWPTAQMFLDVLPLALVVYVLGFGDIVTANEILHDARRFRPDEKLDINPTRTHLNIGIRNTLQALAAGPFPVVHGPLWTGVQVVVTQRYKQGRGAMDSIYGGIAAYYFWGVPILLFLRPITTFLRPMLPVALSMTILLTGFACGYLALALPRNQAERGVTLTTGMVLAQFGAWQALLVGLVMTLVLCGWKTEPPAAQPAHGHHAGQAPHEPESAAHSEQAAQA